jgi:hypothetical protein
MSREVMKLAFTELQNARDYIYLLTDGKQPLTEEEMLNQINAAITALRQALETEKQEPVAWMHTTGTGHVYFRKKPQDKVFSPQPVYTVPLKREWVGLTDDEIASIDGVEMKYIGTGEYVIDGEYEFARAIEAKLKEKNT